MADHNDYDGIKYREESSSPLIFRLLFGGLVVWGAIFTGYYLFSGWSSDGELQQKKKAKAEQVAAAGKGEVAAGHKEGKKEDYIAAGKAEFAAKCAACHGTDAKGSAIGPDLTRKEYKYGRSMQAVGESIGKGRPGGMPAFEGELSHEKIEALIQYLQSL